MASRSAAAVETWRPALPNEIDALIAQNRAYVQSLAASRWVFVSERVTGGIERLEATHSPHFEFERLLDGRLLENAPMFTRLTEQSECWSAHFLPGQNKPSQVSRRRASVRTDLSTHDPRNLLGLRTSHFGIPSYEVMKSPSRTRVTVDDRGGLARFEFSMPDSRGMKSMRLEIATNGSGAIASMLATFENEETILQATESRSVHGALVPVAARVVLVRPRVPAFDKWRTVSGEQVATRIAIELTTLDSIPPVEDFRRYIDDPSVTFHDRILRKERLSLERKAELDRALLDETQKAKEFADRLRELSATANKEGRKWSLPRRLLESPALPIGIGSALLLFAWWIRRRMQ